MRERFFVLAFITVIRFFFSAEAAPSLQQRIFYPQRMHERSSGFLAEREGYRYQEIVLPETHCKLWLFPAKGLRHQHESVGRGAGIIVIYHGNGENRSSHWYIMRHFLDRGFDVVTFDYRGFFDSPTSHQAFPISPETTKEDSIEVYRYVKESFPASMVVLFGSSLGSINCLKAAIQGVKDRRPPEGILIDSGFSSYVELGRAHMKRLLVTLPFADLANILLDDSHAPTVEEVRSLSGIPRCYMHAVFDPVVPFACGKEIQKKGSGKQTFITIRSSSKHADNFYDERVRPLVYDWLRAVRQGQGDMLQREIHLGPEEWAVLGKLAARGVFFVGASAVGASCYLAEKAIEGVWFGSGALIVGGYFLGAERFYPRDRGLEDAFGQLCSGTEAVCRSIRDRARAGFDVIKDKVKDDLGLWFYR